jgi:hypothetical protein
MSDMVARRLGWRRRHQTVLQWFLKYPCGLCADCARATGYSATHISRITCTKEFGARIEKAFEAANDRIARDQILNQILNGRRWRAEKGGARTKKRGAIGDRVVAPIPPKQRVFLFIFCAFVRSLEILLFCDRACADVPDLKPGRGDADRHRRRTRPSGFRGPGVRANRDPSIPRSARREHDSLVRYLV